MWGNFIYMYRNLQSCVTQATFLRHPRDRKVVPAAPLEAHSTRSCRAPSNRAGCKSCRDFLGMFPAATTGRFLRRQAEKVLQVVWMGGEWNRMHGRHSGDDMTCSYVVSWAKSSKVKGALCKWAYESSVVMSMFKITSLKEAFHSVHAHLGGN